MIAKFGRYEVEALCYEMVENPNAVSYEDYIGDTLMVCEEEDAILYGVYRRNKDGYADHVKDFVNKKDAIDCAHILNDREVKRWHDRF